MMRRSKQFIQTAGFLFLMLALGAGEAARRHADRADQELPSTKRSSVLKDPRLKPPAKTQGSPRSTEANSVCPLRFHRNGQTRPRRQLAPAHAPGTRRVRPALYRRARTRLCGYHRVLHRRKNRLSKRAHRRQLCRCRQQDYDRQRRRVFDQLQSPSGQQRMEGLRRGRGEYQPGQQLSLAIQSGHLQLVLRRAGAPAAGQIEFAGAPKK